MTTEIRVAVVSDIVLVGRSVSDDLNRRRITSVFCQWPDDLPPEVDVVVALGDHAVRIPAIKTICGNFRDGSVVVVSAIEHDEQLVSLLAAGATSIVKTNSDHDDLVAAIELAANGHSVLPDFALPSFLNSLRSNPAFVSERECQWLDLIASGMTIHSIANTAGYSERSFYRLLGELYARLGVNGRAQAVIEAQRRGLI